MKLCCLLLYLASVALFSATGPQKLVELVLLWPDGVSGATDDSDEDKPAVIPLVPYPLKSNGAAILVVPGGGLTIRAVDHEGVLVAQWLRDHCIAAFSLRYRSRSICNRNDG